MAKSHPAVIAIGQNKGHPITKFNAKQSAGPKQASKKGHLGKRVKLIRQVIN